MHAEAGLIERRIFLGGGLLGIFASAAGAATPQGRTFQALMAALEQLGDQLPVATSAEQNAYVYRLAAEGMLTPEFPVPKMGTFARTGVEIGPVGMTQPRTDRVHGVAMVRYRMAPGSVLQAHNHPNYSVATIGISGEARVTHFEPESSAPPFPDKTPFLVRKSAERLLRAGEATTLSPQRDNIHTFTAGPRGAEFIDLFSIHGEDVGFSYLEIAPSPVRRLGDEFRAHWVGQLPTNG